MNELKRIFSESIHTAAVEMRKLVDQLSRIQPDFATPMLMASVLSMTLPVLKRTADLYEALAIQNTFEAIALEGPTMHGSNSMED